MAERRVSGVLRGRVQGRLSGRAGERQMLTGRLDTLAQGEAVPAQLVGSTLKVFAPVHTVPYGVTIQNIEGGVDGQMLILRGVTATASFTLAEGGNIKLRGGALQVLKGGHVTLIYRADEGYWMEVVPRSVAVAKSAVVVGQRSMINFIEGTGVTITTADQGYYDRVDVTIAATGGGGGSSTFLGLTDTPSTYEALAHVRVNAAGTALEWVRQGNVDRLYASSYPNAIHLDPSDPSAANTVLTVGDPNHDYRGKVVLGVQAGQSVAVASNGVTGIGGYATTRSSAVTSAYGLNFLAASMSAVTGAELHGTHSGIMVAMGSIAAGYAFSSVVLRLSGALTTYYGLYLTSASTSVATNRYGVYEAGTGSASNTSGNRFYSNTQFGSLTGAFGGGDGAIGVANARTVPSTNPTGGGVLYASGGALYWRGSNGTVTMVAPA